MKQELLDDFKEFLVNYRASWNSLNASRIMSHTSKELKARWAGKDTQIDEWGYEGADEGWKQAYQSYEGRNPIWHFDDILIEVNNQQQGVAVFWVSFEIDDKKTNSKKLFIETFRKEDNEWKKIREYVENDFSNEESILHN